MRIALINSGLGLLTAAAWLHRLRPDADLVLAMDPDGMPWGARTPADIAQRSLSCARAAAAYQPDVLVFACNTGSVHALGALRAEFEPKIPVVGTVPAIKPAAAASDMIAIWATAATTGSAYQRQLIGEFAASARVTEVACPGLADAIHAGDEPTARVAVSDAAARTPAGCRALVLGCTEYELAADLIGSALPGTVLFGSAAAVAAQTLRRVAAANGAGHESSFGATPDSGTAPSLGVGTLHVLLSGRLSSLPAAALRYPEGRLLAAMPVGTPLPSPPAAGNPAAGSPARPRAACN
jgi:glutamate racemase